MAMEITRAALFCKANDEETQAYNNKLLHDYAIANGYVVTASFNNEQELLNDRSDYDIILTCESIMLPIAGIPIQKVV